MPSKIAFEVLSLGGLCAHWPTWENKIKDKTRIRKIECQHPAVLPAR